MTAPDYHDYRSPGSVSGDFLRLHRGGAFSWNTSSAGALGASTEATEGRPRTNPGRRGRRGRTGATRTTGSWRFSSTGSA